MNEIAQSLSELPKSKVTLGLLTGIIALGVVGNAVPSSQLLIGVVPGNTFTSKPHLWAFITAWMFEDSYALVIGNALMVAVVGPRLERTWGTFNYLRYFLFVNGVTFLFAFICLICHYMSVLEDSVLFNPFFGCSALRMAFAVGCMQVMPKRLFTRYIPLSALACHVLAAMLGLLRPLQVVIAVAGLVLGWLFLRFTMRDVNTQVKGDRSEEFSFPKLFPEWRPLQAVLVLVSTVVETALRKMGFCINNDDNDQRVSVLLTPSYSDPSYSDPANTSGLSDPNAERRRAMAIKAIDAKLAQLGGGDQEGEISVSLQDDDDMLMGMDAIDDIVIAAERDAGLDNLDSELAALASAAAEADALP